MAKLGFTFYPKDWWTSKTFYKLDSNIRYLYLEILFEMYMSEDGFISIDKEEFHGKLRCTFTDTDWEKIFDKLEKTVTNDGEFMYTSGTVQSRMKKIISNRQNGKNGGAPEGNSNAFKGKTTQKQPKNNPKTTQNNPPYINIIESKYKEKDNDEVETKTTPPPTNLEFLEISKCRELYDKQHTAAKEQIAMSFRFSPIQLKAFQDEFDKHVISLGTSYKVITDYSSHFKFWIGKLSSEQIKAVLASLNSQRIEIPLKDKYA